MPKFKQALAVCFISIFLLSGCASAPHSNIRENENVDIKMLTAKDICSNQEEKNAWHLAFAHTFDSKAFESAEGKDRRSKDPLRCEYKEPMEIQSLAPVAAAALTYAGGLALDFAKGRVAEEAKKYEANSQPSNCSPISGYKRPRQVMSSKNIMVLK